MKSKSPKKGEKKKKGVPPKRRAPAAPKYRILKTGEPIADGDECFNTWKRSWIPVDSTIGESYEPGNHFKTRREVKGK